VIEAEGGAMSDFLEARLTVSGDFLGAARSKKVSAEGLAPNDHSELSRLISAVAQAGRTSAPGRAGSEVKQYEISLKMADGERTFQAPEGAESVAFKALRTWLEAHGQWVAR